MSDELTGLMEMECAVEPRKGPGKPPDGPPFPNPGPDPGLPKPPREPEEPQPIEEPETDVPEPPIQAFAAGVESTREPGFARLTSVRTFRKRSGHSHPCKKREHNRPGCEAGS
jgi:hypothetical protein